AAQAERRPVLIDFSADWCIPCREMESTTFVDPKVVTAASKFVRLKADMTRQDSTSSQLAGRFEVQGVPTLVVIDSQGRIRKRLVGYVGPREFLDSLREID